MNVDPNKIAHLRKRSSLKQKDIFSGGLTVEDFLKMKEKKIQFDNKVEAVVVNESGEQTGDNLQKASDQIQKDVGKIKISTVAIPEDIKEENEDEKEVIVVEKNLKFDTASPNFESRRKQSVRDEFALAKDLLKMKINMDEELDEDTDETQKNTKHNIQVGQYVEEEDSDTDSDN